MRVYTWNGHAINDTTNYVSFLHHQAYGLPRVNAVSTSRLGRWPVISSVQRNERVIFLEIIIRNMAQLSTKQVELQQWFDPEDETPKKLVVLNTADGQNPRYVYAVCEELQAAPNDENNYTYVATLRIHGDVRWREVTASTLPTPEPPADDGWEITASGQTKVVANNGADVAYPIITIKPTSAKTGGYAYKRYIPIRWRSSTGHGRYPVDIVDTLDTTTTVSNGKVQADGDDLRVFVDGVEVDRWLADMNTDHTKVWVNFEFYGKREANLKTAIADSGAITTIDVYEDISNFPSSGVLIIGTEAFAYTDKNNNLRQFTGVTRSARGTTAAAHSALDDVWWNQHEVFVVYGDASATAPATDDTYKPIFNLSTSTNTSWDYDDFGAGVGEITQRAGGWSFVNLRGSPGKYTADGGAEADPWSEIGITSQVGGIPGDQARWSINNPCGITGANFANGEKFRKGSNNVMVAAIVSAPNSSTWSWEYQIPTPTDDDTWESWSRDESTLNSGTKFVGLILYDTNQGDYIEVADVTLTLDSNYTPACSVLAEQGNYYLNCALWNQTTDEKIVIQFNMALNATLQINCDTKTITYLADGSNQLGALVTMKPTPRRDWFNLAPGNNTWQFDDPGTNAVGINVTWEERHYQ